MRAFLASRLSVLTVASVVLFADAEARAAEPGAPVALPLAAPEAAPAPPAPPSWPTPPPPAHAPAAPAAPPPPTRTPSSTSPWVSHPSSDPNEPVVHVLPWDAPAPVGVRSVSKKRSKLVTAGAVIAGAGYTLAITRSAACAAFKCAGGSDTALLVPVAGPFVQMAQTESVAGNLALAADGLMQLGGLGLVAAGLIFRQETFYPDVSAPRVMLAPVSVAGGRGVGLVGSF